MKTVLNRNKTRVYKIVHFEVSCYKVIKASTTKNGESILEISKDPEWTQLFHKKKYASNLMEDLKGE